VANSAFLIRTMDKQSIYFNIFLSCGMVHLVLAAVMALFARHQVKYLSIAWIIGIFAFALLGVTPYAASAPAQPGVLHPAMLVALLSISYLQSIYPLSIPMPGYLQWERMWKYASPAILLMGLYGIAFVLGSRPVPLYSFSDFLRNLLTGDVLLRLAMLLLSFYYIGNIFRLPHRLTHVDFPHYLVVYSMLLGLSAIFYVVIALNYEIYLMAIYAVIFTLLNAYLCLRTLETTALTLPKPVPEEMTQAPTDEELKKAETDFNEANLQRFQRVEFWMQQNKGMWTEGSFNRDDLCRESGVNRHLLLQCVRSQGYNNVHDYINTYRIVELKRRIARGQISNLSDCLDVGFGTVKTVRSCFEKLEGSTLDDYMKKYQGK